MGTVLVKELLERVAIILQDETNRRWPLAELLRWLVAGEREVVLHKPDAFTTNESVRLSPGTRQEIPAGGNTFIRIVRNMGADGLTPGRAVTPIEMSVLDIQTPDWHTEPPEAPVEHYMVDERDPKRFYVTPPQPDPAEQVELVYAAAPPDIKVQNWDTTTATINLNDIYSNALFDYILYRAYSKNAESADPNRAFAYYQAFANAIGIKIKGEAWLAAKRQEEL